jgi:CPA2 family monovalent cation:H+ antiporter-2
VDHTAPAILELGLLLFLAALAGMAARSLGLPAVIGYLAVGIIVSPFTPGYVANREQLSLLADVGVVLLLFEVGIEINPIRLAREARKLLALAPLQVLITWVVSAAACLALGVHPAGAAMVGLSIAMSSSVVVVNITRSRRRTTDQNTDEVLLSWSVVQDLVGVARLWCWSSSWASGDTRGWRRSPASRRSWSWLRPQRSFFPGCSRD